MHFIHRLMKSRIFALVVCVLLSLLESQHAAPVCPAGWSLYADDGSEGSDSCLTTSSSNPTWPMASRACPSGSHLVTVRSFTSGGSTGLLHFLSTETIFNVWMGMSQSLDSVVRNRGWSWVDGTDSVNLNCGAANDVGCGVWGRIEPK